MKFYLIQRGKINEGTEFSGLTGRDGFVGLDYMGSAEFEFGAIPRAYRRIMGDFEKYEVFDTGMVDKKNMKNRTLQIFCKKESKDEIIDALKIFIENPYHLKEYSGLEKHFCKTSSYLSYDGANFWWDIEHDWIGFIGGPDRVRIFIESIKKDYNDWWLVKSKEDREKELEEAYKRR